MMGDCTITLVHGAGGTADKLISLFEQIAEEEGWSPDGQLRAHVGRSVYFAVSVGGELAGGIQMELPDSSGTWSFETVWPEVRPEIDERAVYLSMFAFARKFRGDRTLFWLPCVEVWKYCKERGIADMWLAATPTTLAAYRRMGWPLEVRSEVRRHWGEDCFLTSMSLDALEASVVARSAKADTYKAVVRQGRAAAG